MNKNQAFVDAFVSAIQIWNLEMDIEESHMDNIDQKSVNRFVHYDLIKGDE